MGENIENSAARRRGCEKYFQYQREWSGNISDSIFGGSYSVRR
jgi:hypothetical protein